MKGNKSNVTINIQGGNNQILPNTTHAVQYFYGDKFLRKLFIEHYLKPNLNIYPSCGGTFTPLHQDFFLLMQSTLQKQANLLCIAHTLHYLCRR